MMRAPTAFGREVAAIPATAGDFVFAVVVGAKAHNVSEGGVADGPLVAPPLPERLPPAVVELACASPVFLRPLAPPPIDASSPCLDRGHARAEIMAVVQTPSGRAEWVGSVADVALPDPLQRR